MKQFLWASGGTMILAILAFAQQSPGGPSFDVASVKLAPDVPDLPFFRGAAEHRRFQGGPGSKTPGRIDYSGVTLKKLLEQAYSLRPEQVDGPRWFDVQRYTIAATFPPATSRGQFRLMLQNLLLERFQLRLHRESRPVRVYHLLVAKSGPKLAAAKQPRQIQEPGERQAAIEKRLAEMAARDRQRNGDGLRNSFEIPRAAIAEFVDTLSAYVDRPVVDRTELDGLYSFHLEWVPDGTKPAGDAPLGPSIFAALEEQLGLKLQAATDQLEVLVLDEARRIPVSN